MIHVSINEEFYQIFWEKEKERKKREVIKNKMIKKELRNVK